jgi:hypothetical protein
MTESDSTCFKLLYRCWIVMSTIIHYLAWLYGIKNSELATFQVLKILIYQSKRSISASQLVKVVTKLFRIIRILDFSDKSINIQLCDEDSICNSRRCKELSHHVEIRIC